MKRLFMLLCAVVAFAACEQAPIKEMQGAAINERNLEVSFEGGDDTRIQLQNDKTVWNEGDHVSVFYRSNVNEEWLFMGETGDRIGNIVPVDNTLNPPVTHNRVVVIYPYNNEYYLNTEKYSIEASLPAVQSYLKDSYGTNGNIMISSSEYNQFSLKSVCGWLKLQLSGDGETIKSIKFRGNDGEQVAGELYINTSDATCVLASASGEAGDGEVGGTLVRPGTILTEVTLDCGDGVTLGAEATAFYIALPPQIFEKGFTVVIENTEGDVMEQSTDKALIIERNHIQPMAALEFINPNPASNQIWYTSSDGNVVKPNNTKVFGANIISNKYSNGMGVITFDGNVTTIGNDAFFRCSSLTSVNIPDSVTEIGSYAFYLCNSLTSVTIGDSVTKIGEGAFKYCNSLTSVNIPDSVTSIGIGAFCYCESLTSVNIPDSVTKIGYEAFRECYSLTEFTGKFAEDNGRILVVDGVLTSFAPEGITEYNIPDSVTTIGEGAFFYCESLTSVTIGDSVTSIGRSAFWDCTSLTSVTIPDSVTTIGEYAFYECTSLTCVYCKATTPPALGYNAFYNNASGRRIYVYEECVELYKSAWSSYTDSIYTNSQNCPETTTIQYTTNDGNTITSSKLPIISNIYENGVGTLVVVGKIALIPNYAFSECTNLTSVNIPDSVTSIGSMAFYGCTSLTSVAIGDSVTKIGGYTFYGCDSLISVTIGDSVTWIGYDAFEYCGSLTSVYCKATTPPVLGNTYVFDENGSGRKIYVPAGSVNAYKSAEYWNEYADAIVGYDFENGVVVDIPNNEIWYTAKDKVTQYNSDAFNVTIQSHEWNSTTGIGVITFDGEVTAIDNDAFYYCDDLTSVTIPKSVSKIGYTAFYRCYNLKSVYCTSITPPTAALDYYEEWYAFDSNASGRKIYVPYESVDAYRSADGWSEYASAIVGYI